MALGNTSLVISAILYFILAPFAGALLAGIDRRVTARMQGRQGPPLLQPLYDVSKLLRKQTKVINRVQLLYLSTFLFFIIVTGLLFFAGYDILLILFTLTTANIFLVIAASSGHSPYAFMGASRELVQMLAYEPMVLIAAIGLYVVTGSFKVSDIINHNGAPAVIYLPGIFLGFLFIMTIKLRKHPFDLSTSHHAHQELVKGITTEFNGKMFAIVEISHWYENIFLIGLLSLFFLNSSKLSILLAIVGVIACYFVEILIDNTNARFKWKTMLDNTWIVTAVLGALNLIVIEVLKGKGVI
ncbi:complex I subunit 1 family protein [uncultured Eubacterium sp.]|uniref:respiratory chain complex I subunit 1 family protein n=1 Tax=uncultured Eubacterium sp. TaxID=165185 RepID=UPI0015B33BA4|nr:complex I subunit 1 family protein [uncultured Eubacterium sp.]